MDTERKSGARKIGRADSREDSRRRLVTSPVARVTSFPNALQPFARRVSRKGNDPESSTDANVPWCRSLIHTRRLRERVTMIYSAV